MSLIIQTVFANLIDWLFKPLDNLCSQLLTGAFSGLVGSMSNDEWNVAITAANRIGWIMGFVNMALCVIGALQAAAKGSVADVIKSFAMAVLAWPLTAVCISVMITMDGIVGQITHRILTVPLNGVGTSDPFGDSIVSNLIGTIVKTTGGYDLIIRCVVDFVLFLAVLALAGMLAARDISLILLACVAPLPVMMTGWKVTRPAAAKWAQAVVGVLLSAPLSALVIMVGSGICFVSKNNPNYAESFFPALMGIATIIMACFSPKLIMPAVSFIGENVTADMQERGGKIGPNAIKAAVQVTASVVQTATGGATGGLGKVVNSGAGAVLGAAQGNPAAVGSSIPGIASGVKDMLPKDSEDTSKGSVKDSEDYGTPKPASTDDAAAVPPVASDGMDHSGSSQVMDAASAPSSDGDSSSTTPTVAPAPNPTPDVSLPDARESSQTSSVSDGQTVAPAPNPAPNTSVPGAPGGRGGDAHADGDQGGRGADGGQGARGADGGQGGTGGRGGDGGMGGMGGSGGSNPYQGGGAPSGPTVGGRHPLSTRGRVAVIPEGTRHPGPDPRRVPSIVFPTTDNPMEVSMSDNESNAGRSRVPSASFSRLSATRVVLGLDKAQLIVCVIGLAILVAGAAMGLNVPIMILGALVLAYGIPRIQGLSLVSWTWIWTHWRGRLKDGTNRWAYSPLASGRPLGVLGLYGHVEDRAQTIEGDGVEVVGTPFQGACYLWDPDKRQATAVLTANVEEWVLSSDRQKTGRAMALNTMLKELSETDGFVELKETSFVLPGHTPPEPEYLKSDKTPQWAREDLANLWHLPDILTPLQNSNYISVSVNADRLPHVVRKDRTERAAVGIAMGDLIRMTVAPSLLDCGARRNTIHWCSVDDLRYLIRTVADPEHAADRPPVNRDDPTVTWVEEAKEHDYITLDSCVARSFWIYQWPDFDVEAGWIRELVTERRMMAFCHIWRPLTMEQSEAELRNRKSSMRQRSKLQDQREKSRDERREEKEQRLRELEQEANWPDTDHQGFITLFASSLPELDVFDRDMQNKAKNWHMKLNPMKGQQRAALTTILPLGI